MLIGCLFSPIKGRVVRNGQPVAGARLVRSWRSEWAGRGGKGTDQVTTDENGWFCFRPVRVILLLGLILPGKPVIHQTLDIMADGRKYRAWYYVKHNYKKHGELCFRWEKDTVYLPFTLTCDLDAELKAHEAGLTKYVGIATLDYEAPATSRLCIFSPVKGRIVHKGRPVADAVLHREYQWVWASRWRHRDNVTTDENGEFQFPGVYATILGSSEARHKPVVKQSICANVDQKTYLLWASVKYNYGEYGEPLTRDECKATNAPFTIFCDLDA
jgi:hypothetical protein